MLRAHRVSVLTLLLCLATHANPALPRADEPSQPAPGKDPEPIDKLIEQLGNDDPQVREAATRKLLKREEALPALQKALKSEDAEVRQRAEFIIKEMEQRRKEREDRQLVERLNGVDRLIDRMVAQGAAAGNGHWEDVLKLARLVAEKTAGTVRHPVAHVLGEEPLQYPCVKLDKPTDEQAGQKKRILSTGLDSKWLIVKSIVVCAGPIRVEEAPLFASIILANGDVTVSGPVTCCLIFCDGDVELTGPVTDNVIIATGAVKAGNATRNNEIQSSGRGALFELFPLFDPARLGGTASAVDGGVRLTKVQADKPFGKAGLREGDVVVAVSGTEVKSGDSFRKLLRRALAAKGEAALRVRRADEALEVTVRAAD